MTTSTSSPPPQARHESTGPPRVPSEDTPPAASAVAQARIVLLTHRLDPAAGGCAGCGASSPCESANEAAAVIVAAGAWNTLPFHGSPAGSFVPAGEGASRESSAATVARWVAACARALHLGRPNGGPS